MEVHLATCLTLIKQGQWQQARDLLLELPEVVEVLEMRAYVAKQLNDWVAAEQALKAALQLANKPNTQALLASLLYQQQRYTEASEIWQQVLIGQPQSFQGHFQLAQCHLAQQNYQAAQLDLEWCVQQQPTDVAVLFQLATVHCQLKQESQAKSIFEAVLRLDPYHLEALNNYGVVCLQAGDHDKAIHCFATAMRIDDQHLPSRANLAQVLLQSGRYQEARVYFEQYLALAPDDLNACYNAGVTELMMAERDLAAHYFQTVLASAPDNVASLLNLAAISLHKQETSNAIGYYQRALCLEPTQPIATYMLSALLTKDTPLKAPDDYVSALFDQYATHFDQHLCGALSYQTPQHLRRLYDLKDSSPPKHLLDLGCGTGLSGAAFADYGACMVGVDLSDAMLAKARAKNLYQAIYCSEMVAYLRQTDLSFDCIIAADVLVYVGDLSEWFQGVVKCLTDEGWLLFSIEQSSSKNSYELTNTGRFQHQIGYVEHVAIQAGLRVMAKQKVTLRLQEGRDVEGYVLACCK